PMPNPEAMAVLARASVGLCPLRDLPNYRSSQPTKILEYLAMGLPVVASDLPGTRSLVAGLDAVFLTEPGDSDALAGAISRARDPEVLAAARAQADMIRDRYSWPASEVVGFYESLISTG
ncbi:MAG: glycosyltransferase, partial [Acidimicrobiia bacterium]